MPQMDRGAGQPKPSNITSVLESLMLSQRQATQSRSRNAASMYTKKGTPVARPSR